MFHIELANGVTVSVAGSDTDFGAIAAKMGERVAAFDDINGQTHYVSTQHVVQIYEGPE